MEGVVDAADETITVLRPDELFDFASRHQHLLPAGISNWLM
jgi:hypothetical protein